MKKIILDTNILLLPGQFMVDIFTQIEQLMDEPFVLVILQKSLNELNKIAQKKTKDAQAARLALALINAKLAENPTFWEKIIGLTPHKKEKKIQVIKTKEYVDDAIIKLADTQTIVATLDSQLKKRLRQKNIKTITLKNKKQLSFV